MPVKAQTYNIVRYQKEIEKYKTDSVMGIVTARHESHDVVIIIILILILIIINQVFSVGYANYSKKCSTAVAY